MHVFALTARYADLVNVGWMSDSSSPHHRETSVLHGHGLSRNYPRTRVLTSKFMEVINAPVCELLRPIWCYLITGHCNLISIITAPLREIFKCFENSKLYLSSFHRNTECQITGKLIKVPGYNRYFSLFGVIVHLFNFIYLSTIIPFLNSSMCNIPLTLEIMVILRLYYYIIVIHLILYCFSTLTSLSLLLSLPQTNPANLQWQKRNVSVYLYILHI